MSASTKAKRPRSRRRTAADRALSAHLEKCSNLDRDKLDEHGWGVAILDGTGSTIATLSDVSLREAIHAVETWEISTDGGFEIIPPGQNGGQR